MKPIDLIPVQLDVYHVIKGVIDHIEVLNDHFVVYGDLDDSHVEHLWIAPTGKSLPDNRVAHIQTLQWTNGQRLVAHFFELDGPPHGQGYNEVVWKKHVDYDNFELRVEAEFIHIDDNPNGGLDVWFITDTHPINGDRYTITTANSARANIVFKNDQWAIVHVAQAARVIAGTMSGRMQSSAIHTAGQASSAPTASNTPEAVNNGMVFNYEKQDGSRRLVRCARLEFIVLGNGRQAINAWDLDRKDWRTFILNQIVDFPQVREV